MSSEAPRPDLEAVIRSASLAATLPPSGADAVVEWAVRAGARAAERGVALPLPVLLDVRSLWIGRTRPRRLLRPAPSPSEESRAYEEWLAGFCDRCRAWFGIPAGGHASTAESLDILPALVSAWPDGGPSAVGFRSLYTALEARENLSRVLSAWEGPRDADVSRLRRWLPGTDHEPEPTLAGGFWSLHATAGETVWLDATFDHEAARMYLSAPDPPLSPEQQRRIIKLRRRRQSTELSRFPHSFEEPNPYAGAWMLATLVLEEIGDHKIVNGTDIRISSNPPAVPPRDVDVHLHWAFGTAGLRQKHAAPRFGERPAPAGVRPEDASVLQGFAALLFDDWRCALRNLPVRFHAHCGVPDAAGDSFGRGGRRWKPSASSAVPMPPQRAVARFFRRCDWTALPERGLRWQPPRRLGGWGCLLVLRCDLCAFGFTEGEQERFPGQLVWRAKTAALPGSISTVIILDAPGGHGVLCRALRSHSEVFLAPVHRRAMAESKPDPAFLDIRSSALDLLLDALEQLLR
jgi:hypothetical protein